LQKLSLSKRPGLIGGSIVNRTENHGPKEKVPAISVKISGILLTQEELCALMQDEGAWDALFTGARSKHPEPRFLGIDPLAISDKFKEAKATIKCDNATEAVILKPATIGSISLEPQVGGLTAMTCMISGVPPEHTDTLAMLNRKCTVSILNGSLADRNENQKELPLGEGGLPTQSAEEDSEGDDNTLADAEAEEEEATASALGRRIGNASKKRASKKK
jgi:hypothetical protein